MRMIILFLFAISLLCFPGCSASDPPVVVEGELVGPSWLLNAVVLPDGDIWVPEADTMYTVQFFEDGRFEGWKECNRCEGEYELGAANNLHIIQFACTESGCPDAPPFPGQYANFRFSLSMATSYEIKDAWLQIYYHTLIDERTHTLRFRAR